MRASPVGLPLLLVSLCASPAAAQVSDAPAAAEFPSAAPPTVPAPVDAPPAVQTPAAPAAPGEPNDALPAPAAPTPPAPAMAIAVAPPTPAKTPDVADAPHHGKPSRFFAALALGGGYFHASSGAREDRRSFSGGTFSGQLAMGGRIGRKTLIGGAYLHDEVFGLSSTDEVLDGDEPNLSDVGFALWAVGFFADVPVAVEPGLHFQMLLGIGTLAVSREGDADDPNGLLVNLGVGYDFRVGRHLAMGALLRASYSPQDVKETAGTNVLAFVPALLLTATTR